MKRLSLFFGALLVLGGFALANSAFIVDEREQALVIMFGEHQRTIESPGLNFKIPFVQNVVIVERRVLDLDPSVEEVILADQRRLQVDAFARYRIVDPLQFYKAIGGGTDFRIMERTLQSRLAPQLSAAMRSTLGSVTLVDILSNARATVISRIAASLREAESTFGIKVVDVRIRRADLPDQTSQAIYGRMKSERDREASEFRAQGLEQGQQIRSRAERERTVLLAEAEREAQRLRGEGDRQAIRIQAEAYGKAPEFFVFYRSLQAYRETLQGDDTTMVLNPRGDFFQYFENAPVGVLPTPAAEPVPQPAAEPAPQ
jgi:modulator of FtsH protease HflC